MLGKGTKGSQHCRQSMPSTRHIRQQCFIQSHGFIPGPKESTVNGYLYDNVRHTRVSWAAVSNCEQ
jgi:hypothetical protein